MHTHIHTCIACMHAYMHTRIHAYLHTCTHAYMHICIPYIHYLYYIHYIHYIHYIQYIQYIHYTHYIHFMHYIHYIHYLHCAILRTGRISRGQTCARLFWLRFLQRSIMNSCVFKPGPAHPGLDRFSIDFLRFSMVSARIPTCAPVFVFLVLRKGACRPPPFPLLTDLRKT